MSPRGSFGLASSAILKPYLLIDRVLAEVVDRLAQSFDGFVWPTARVGLGAFAPAPQHEDLRAELRAEIHRPHRFLNGVRADAIVVGGERTVAEHRIEKEIHGCHRHHDAVVPAGADEVLDDAIAIGRRCIDRYQVVVVEVHAPRARLRQHRHRIGGRQRWAHNVAERVAAPISDRPEAERKLVFWSRCE